MYDMMAIRTFQISSETTPLLTLKIKFINMLIDGFAVKILKLSYIVIFNNSEM